MIHARWFDARRLVALLAPLLLAGALVSTLAGVTPAGASASTLAGWTGIQPRAASAPDDLHGVAATSSTAA